VPYKNILVAIDLSEESNQVVSRAKEIADSSGAELSLIYVREPLHQVHGDALTPYGANKSLDYEARKEAEIKLKEIATKWGILPGECFVPLGNPTSKIRQTAKKLKSDLVVIGTHGRKGAKKLLLGSNAHSLLNGTQTDVQVIKIK
jgi:universal stress protein A